VRCFNVESRRQRVRGFRGGGAYASEAVRRIRDSPDRVLRGAIPVGSGSTAPWSAATRPSIWYTRPVSTLRSSVFYPLAVNIGLRYANSRRSFISFISIVAIAGLVLSVAVLVLVTSVMNGFERELKERVLGVVPHLTVRGVAPLSDWTADAADLAKVPGVVGVAPFIDGTGLLVANGRSSGVTFSGIDVAREGAVSDLAKYVSRGRIESLVDGSFGVDVGSRRRGPSQCGGR
jgi:hypothetical protein